MRILVTGATGFLGGALARRLSHQQHEVVASGRDRRRGAKLSAAGLDFQAADLCARGAAEQLCEGVDAVVHCAALSSPWGARRAFLRANVEATEALLAACQRRGVARLVHISTPSLYMGAGDREQVREDDPLPPPINHYAATKLECERRVQRAVAQGLQSIVLRPRAIFGPGDTTIFPRVLTALEQGRLPVIGDGRNRVDLTYIDNAVQAVERALAAPPQAWGKIYNVSNGEPVLLWDVLRWLSAELGLPPPRGSLPRWAGMAVGGALELFHRVARPSMEPKLTRYSVQVLSCTMTLDIRRAREQLGYAPEVSVQQGLTEFVRWWKQEASCRA
jgi:nucleoside-diphosphate-sugar epimerase